MKKSTTIAMLLTVLSAMLSASVFAATSANIGYAVDAESPIVKNGTGGCWHTSYWTPELAVSGCDAVKEESIVAPASVPAPVAKAAAAPKESWKTVLTEKPVRLEGATLQPIPPSC